jgi:hypothetical protein
MNSQSTETTALPVPFTGKTVAIRDYCREHFILRLALFGSFLSGHERPDSDIDLLVEFEPAHVPGLIALGGMANELSGILGHPVDLRTPQDLSRYFRDDVVASAQVIHEQR